MEQLWVKEKDRVRGAELRRRNNSKELEQLLHTKDPFHFYQVETSYKLC